MIALVTVKAASRIFGIFRTKSSVGYSSSALGCGGLMLPWAWPAGLGRAGQGLAWRSLWGTPVPGTPLLGAGIERRIPV